MLTRREFLQRGAVAVAAAIALPARASAHGTGHPTPRAGITGDKVLTRAQLSTTPSLVSLFDAVRSMPEIVDGIRCNCGCSTMPGFYSLLSCYEDDGMARDCRICQGQGRLAARLNRDGRSLDEIRAAIDAKFG